MMVLLKAQELAEGDNCLASACTARMMWINMFFLCRPGESCATRYGSKFFRLRDVTLINGELVLNWRSSDRELRHASDVHLTFTDQKNKHRNEKVGQKRTSHEKASPTVAVADQVIHLRNNNAPPDTPLCAFTENGHWFVVTSELYCVGRSAHALGADSASPTSPHGPFARRARWPCFARASTLVESNYLADGGRTKC